MVGKKRKSGSDKQPKHRLSLGTDASKRLRYGAAKQHQADEEASIPFSLSAKILREACKQQKEEEMLTDSSDQVPTGVAAAAAAAGPGASSSFPVPATDDDEDDVDKFEVFDTLSEYDSGEVEINEEDEKALAAFMSKDNSAQRTLGGIILQKKIREKDAEVSAEGRPRVKLDNSIVELYKEVGKFLSRYTSVKIPKAFKRIPSLECWAEMLQLTEPENWSLREVWNDCSQC